MFNTKPTKSNMFDAQSSSGSLDEKCWICVVRNSGEKELAIAFHQDFFQHQMHSLSYMFQISTTSRGLDAKMEAK